MKITFHEQRSVGGELYGYLVEELWAHDNTEELKEELKVKEKLREIFPSIEIMGWCGAIRFIFNDKADEAYFQLFLNDELEID